MSVLAPIGSVLFKMLTSIFTSTMIKFTIVKLLEYAVNKYERKAKKTASLDDDLLAASFKEGLEKIKDSWEKI